MEMFVNGGHLPSFSGVFGPTFRQVRLGKTMNLTMSTTEQTHLSTIERIERALLVLAYFIELDGDVHVPMYEKLEAELAELRKQEDTKARARKLLLSYTNVGSLKAIC